MTKEELLNLRKIESEIHQLKYELQNIKPEHGKDSVTGSMVGFPYIKHSIVIEGYDYQEYDSKMDRVRKRLNRKINELAEEKDRLTQFICGLEDSELRQILMYRYMNGLTWKEIGEKMKYDESSVRKKHNKWLGE